MRVQGDDRALPIFQVLAEVFDLVGITVGRAAFHCGGQVQNDLVLRRCVEQLHNPFANGNGIVHLRAGEALRRILIADVNLGMLFEHLVRELLDELCTIGRDLDDAVHILLEHDLAL